MRSLCLESPRERDRGSEIAGQAGGQAQLTMCSYTCTRKQERHD